MISIFNRFTIDVLIFSALFTLFAQNAFAQSPESEPVTRVFIFAGQSNMEGADSKIQDVKRFPPFAGLEEPQTDVKFSYCIGRENKKKSDGWVPLQSVKNFVGPELSFARKVKGQIEAPIAIIKCAAGGTHLGGDWNPDEPSGFKMYPLALNWVKDALAQLDAEGIKYRIEGFMWHQGENDMFNEEYKLNYGKNLENFVASWRRDLELPELKFYVGELCTKTIWGMDLRPRMYAISLGQRQVTQSDSNAQYIPTSHVGVEIGGGVGLHYHYGTLGQLEHGENYADAYLQNIGKLDIKKRPLKKWPYETGSKVKLFVLAGHRNMEGERGFVSQLKQLPGKMDLANDDPTVAYRFSIGGGYKASEGWEPIGPAGFYNTFGPELSFTNALKKVVDGPIAISKFTHSGSQIIDWSPEGSIAKSRNLYPSFIQFIKESVQELKDKGHEVELAGIFYHLGENDMSFGPFRKSAAEHVKSFVGQSRTDLGIPDLKWFVSQQPPTDHERVNKFDVVSEMKQLAETDENLTLIFADKLPKQEKQLVLDTAGIVAIGELIASRYLEHLGF